MNALLIGCGNIGALYDFQKEGIKTHCKALSRLKGISVSIYDIDKELAKNVSEEYGFACIVKEDDICPADYQWVAIASPTNTHLSWLKKCIDAKVQLLICEKPVAKTASELSESEALYKNSDTKIVVNYFRRFQPVYLQLKDEISWEKDKPSQVIIKYQRGIVNNFSHAADLLDLLFGEHVFDKINITRSVFDEFDDDPTLSFTAEYNGIPVYATGLANVRYSFFEIEIFFRDKKISILDGGNKIIYAKAPQADRYYQPLKADDVRNKENLLTEHMMFVYEHVQKVYNSEEQDNFISSVRMNQQILRIIQQ
jgi:predicted dehydrogenase